MSTPEAPRYVWIVSHRKHPGDDSTFFIASTEAGARTWLAEEHKDPRSEKTGYYCLTKDAVDTKIEANGGDGIPELIGFFSLTGEPLDDQPDSFVTGCDHCAEHKSDTESMQAELAVMTKWASDRDRLCDILMTVCEALEIPRCEDGPCDDASVYTKAIDGFYDDHHVRQIAEQRDQARTELAEALREATWLAQHMHRAHFQQDAPQWEAFDDLRGVLSQIDNMYMGVVAKLTAGVVPQRFDAWHDDAGTVIWWAIHSEGRISEPPQHVGDPRASDWPYRTVDEPHLLWVPLPKLAADRPLPEKPQ